MIVMLLTSFRYRDMRDEVRVVLHGDVIMHARWFRLRTLSHITQFSVYTLNGTLCSVQYYSTALYIL